jgi:hypothetical protein
MRPIRVFQIQTKHKMDMGCDCVLDLLSDYRDPIPTETLVAECHKEKIAAPATTYKRLGILKGKGFVADYTHPTDHDRRKSYIVLTKLGLGYLQSWEGGE